MSFPGLNLYGLASQIIGGASYTLFQSARTLDDRGIWVTTFDNPGTPLTDSIQPIPTTLYEQMGLDLKRYYIMIYTDNPLVLSLERNTSGGQIEFNGQRFQVQSNTDWLPQDGWQGLLAVRLEPAVSP